MSKTFRGLPSVNELLDSPPLRSLVKRVQPAVVVGGVRQFLEGMRTQVQSAAASIPAPGELAQRIADWIATERPLERPAINATGVLLSRELGGPPLAEQARDALAAATIDYSLVDGALPTASAAPRAAEAERLLARQTGAELAIVASSYASAQLWAMAALAGGREVVISRGQLLESADGTRTIDLLAAGGVALRAVGASNRTRLSDYAEAISERTAAIVVVQDGASLVADDAQAPALGEVAALSRRHNLPTIQFLGGAALVDLSAYALPGQPVPSDSMQAGVNLVCFAGNGCVGGPPCGAIAGRRSLVETVAGHPLARAFAADRLTSAALAATLRLMEDAGMREQSIPLFSLLATPLENLKNRAERLAPQLAATGIGRVEVREGTSTLRGFSAPAETLRTWRLAIAPASGDAETLAAALRAGHPAVVGRIEGVELLIDLRSVFPRQDMQIAAAFEALAKEIPGAKAAVEAAGDAAVEAGGSPIAP